MVTLSENPHTAFARTGSAARAGLPKHDDVDASVNRLRGTDEHAFTRVRMRLRKPARRWVDKLVGCGHGEDFLEILKGLFTGECPNAAKANPSHIMALALTVAQAVLAEAERNAKTIENGGKSEPPRTVERISAFDGWREAIRSGDDRTLAITFAQRAAERLGLNTLEEDRELARTAGKCLDVFKSLGKQALDAQVRERIPV